MLTYEFIQLIAGVKQIVHFHISKHTFWREMD